MDAVSMLLWAVAIVAAAFVAYNLFHYVLFLLATHPKDAGGIGHALNEFEQRQLVEWVPKADDFLKHDDENRTYDDVFGPYRGEHDNYSTCVFPRAIFTHPYEADCALLAPADGMRLLELGCGSGAAADYLASQRKVEITCVTNSAVQADICRRKFEKCGGRVSVMLTDFDRLDLPDNSFDAIYAFESIGYTKDLDAWLARAAGACSSPAAACSSVHRDRWIIVAGSRTSATSLPSSTIGATIFSAPTFWCSSCAGSASSRSAIAICHSGPGA